jgi:hypothetical protein
MNKIFTISGLILAASVGFFVSAVVFKGDNKLRYEEQMEIGQGDPDSFPGENGMAFHKNAKSNRGFMMQGPSKYKMDSLIGLSKDQIAAMDQHKQASDSLRKALTTKIRDAEFRLHDALDAETISEADLKVIRTDLLTLNEQRLDSRIANIRFFISTLTPEQTKKLRDMDAEMMKQMKDVPREMNKFDGDADPGEMEPGGPRRDGQGPHMGGNGPRPMTLPPQER